MAIDIAELRVMFGADTAGFKRGIGDVMKSTKAVAASFARTSQLLQNITHSSGAFRDIAGKKFVSAAEGVESFGAIVNEQAGVLDAYRDSLLFAKSTSVAQRAATLNAIPVERARRAEIVKTTGAQLTASQSSHGLTQAMARNVRQVRVMRTEVARTGGALKALGLVNFNVLRSVTSWNTLDVLAGPGSLVTAFDAVRRSLFGVQPPMRRIVFFMQTLVTPLIAVLAHVARVAAQFRVWGREGQIAFAALSEGLRKVGVESALFGQSFRGTLGLIFQTVGAGIAGGISSGLSAAGRGINSFVSAVPGKIKSAFEGTLTGVTDKVIEQTTPKSSLDAFEKFTAGAQKAKTKNDELRASFDAAKGPIQSAAAAWRVYFRSTSQTDKVDVFLANQVRGIKRLGVAARETFDFVTRTTVIATKALYHLTRVPLGIIVRGAREVASAFARFTHVAANVTQVSGAFKLLLKPITMLATPIANAARRILGFKRNADAAKASTSMFSRALGLLKTTIAPIAGVTAALAAMRAGIGGAVREEQTTVQFATLLGSADAAKQRIKDLATFSESTPFSIAGVTDANRQLQILSQGALANDETMRLVGDTAAATGRPFKEIARLVGRTYAALQSGDPIGETTRRLLELGAITPQAKSEIEALQASGASSQEVFARFRAEMERNKGGMLNLSQTTGGLFSTMKDKVLRVFINLGAGLMRAFRINDLIKGISAGAEFFSSTVVPLFVTPLQYVSSFFVAAFAQIGRTVGAVMTSVASIFGTSASSMGRSAFEWIGGVLWGAFEAVTGAIREFLIFTEFAASNFGDAWQLASDFFGLAFHRVVSIGQDVFRFFGDVLGWFGRNWYSVFVDAGNLVSTVFGNVAQNVRAVFERVWDFVTGGGKETFENDFVGILDGFQSTIAEKFPTFERKLTDSEKRFSDQLAESLGTYEEFAKERRKQFEDERNAAAEGPGTADLILPEKGGGDIGDALKKVDAGGKKKDGDKIGGSDEQFAAAAEEGTAAAYSAIIQDRERARKDEAKRQLDATRDIVDKLEELIEKENPPLLLPAAF